jgi:hypothetical protein
MRLFAWMNADRRSLISRDGEHPAAEGPQIAVHPASLGPQRSNPTPKATSQASPPPTAAPNLQQELPQSPLGSLSRKNSEVPCPETGPATRANLSGGRPRWCHGGRSGAWSVASDSSPRHLRRPIHQKLLRSRRRPNRLNNPLQIIKRSKLHDDLALALPHLNLDPSIEMVRQPIGQSS